jgi:release factor glutamine methyltransferase
MSSMPPKSPEDPGALLVKARTLGEALVLATRWLRSDASNDTAALDAQLLLAHVTGISRATLLAYPERLFAHDAAERYAALVARRVAHEPVSYLTGHREFMGLDFLTDRRALIPRPETELLVESVLVEVRARMVEMPGSTPLVADIGTGSGAIAVALARLEPRLETVYATDVSPDALELARENARRLGVEERVRFLQGDLLQPLPQRVDVLLANLPYVAPCDETLLADDVRRYEPSIALYGDDDGLGHLRRLFAQAPEFVAAGAAIVLEFGYDQRSAVESLARATFAFAEVVIKTDYAGWDRLAIIHTAARFHA